ncbi:hypothetical protein [Phormidium sp. CCY1219]|uniref:hypothetical protein n=1 Tax=Phormidium sp. CCY1219 TaxID=2886104 RepID=UPI002D1F5D7C|nr:hypothetical protein [Phormidium sp. CCY1219]MEB3829244.1 hypothetical protein [Phormidium sp. CCY1219]
MRKPPVQPCPLLQGLSRREKPPLGAGFLTDVDPKLSSPATVEDPQGQTGDTCGAIEKIFFS